MNKIIFYSTHCPRCIILEKKLKEKGISYEECNDIDIMTNLGFLEVPKLEVDGKILDYKEANYWINNIKI